MNKEEITKRYNDFYNYYSLEEFSELLKENTNLKQTLNEIREYINEDNYKDETIWCEDLIPIKKIIDKVLGDDKR